MTKDEKILQEFTRRHFGNKNVELLPFTRYLRSRGYRDIGTFLAIAESDPEELENVRRRALKHQTEFLRNAGFWEAVWNKFVLRLDVRREVRVLSLGCSTGLEPATIALQILKRLPLENLRIEAWDLSAKVIEEARRPDIPTAVLDALRDHHPVLNKYLQGTPQKRSTLRPCVLERIEYHVGDVRVLPGVTEGWWTGKDDFYDFIFCRYMMVHLTAPDVAELYSKMAQCLRLGEHVGFLGIGRSDPRPPMGLLKQITPNLFQRKKPVS